MSYKEKKDTLTVERDTLTVEKGHFNGGKGHFYGRNLFYNNFSYKIIIFLFINN